MSLDKSYLDIARQRVRDGWHIVCRVAPPPTTVWANPNVSNCDGCVFTEAISRECANELEQLGIVECTDEWSIDNRRSGGAYILAKPKSEPDVIEEDMTRALMAVIPGFGDCNSPAQCVGTCVKCLTRLRNPTTDELEKAVAWLKSRGAKP